MNGVVGRHVSLVIQPLMVPGKVFKTHLSTLQQLLKAVLMAVYFSLASLLKASVDAKFVLQKAHCAPSVQH